MLTTRQIEKRQHGLGASDLACLFGLDPFRTAYDLWLLKSGQIEPDAETPAMRRGNYAERWILDYVQDELGKLRRNQHRRIAGSIISVNLDAVLVQDGIPVEAKSIGFRSPDFGAWGEAGTDEVPDRVIIQVTAQMQAVGAGEAVVAASVGGELPSLYRVPFNQGLATAIVEKAESFWCNHVLKRVAPDWCAPSLDLVRKVRRVPEKVVEIAAALLDGKRAADEAFKAAKEAKEQADAALIGALGDAEAGTVPDGRAVTYLSSHFKGYEVKASERRTLRVKAKGGVR